MNAIIRNILLVLILILGGGYIAYAQISTPAPSPAPTETPLPTYTPPNYLFENLPEFSPPVFQPNSIVPPLTLDVTPSSPSSGETVTVTAQGGSFDETTANFIWTIDGKSRSDLSGIGRNSFTYTVGSVGSQSRISVRAVPQDDTPTTAVQVVYVTDVSLVWSADTYIPKWYKGKALPIPNSTIHVAAIPTIVINGSTIAPSKLMYTWEINGQRILRGIGKQSITLKQPEQSWDAPTILLAIEDTLGRIHKEARVGIPSSSPRAVIYQSLPLGGVEFRRGTSAFPAVTPSIVDLQVEPFFFNTTSRYDLIYAWSVQNITASSSPKNPFLMTLDMQKHPPSHVPLSITVSHKNTDIVVPSASSFLTIPIVQ